MPFRGPSFRRDRRLIVLFALVVLAGCQTGSGPGVPLSLGAIADVTTPRTESVEVAIEITDDAPESVVVTASSDDASIVPASGLSVLGGGTSPTLRIEPAPLASGSAQIAVTARDAEGTTVTETFTLTTTVPFLAERWKLRGSEAVINGRFGPVVDVCGTTVVIGAPNEPGGDGLSGTAYVFVLEDGVWSEAQRLVPPDAAPGDSFGASVAIDGDVLVVGAPGHEHGAVGNGRGAAYVFRWNGTSWVFEDELLAPDGSDFDRFGYAVDVSGDAVVASALFWEPSGSTLVNPGGAYVFRRLGASWLYEQTLVSSTPMDDEYFGAAVAIDGDDVLIGAWRGTGAVGLAGAAYAFRYDGSSWETAGKLFAPASEAVSNMFFGIDVALHDGTAIVGAYGAVPGGVYEAGAAYVFTRSGSVWGAPVRLTASDGVTLDQFGRAVDVHGRYVLVSAPGRNDGASNAGVVYLFHLDESVWTQQALLQPSEPGEDDYLGEAIALSDTLAVVGNEQDDDDGAESGSVYAYLK